MELRRGIEEPKRSSVFQTSSKRVRMIFSVMASPNRIDILRILNSKGPITYSELKAFAGFRSKKESGKFAYHLRKLLRQSLVSLNKSERRYTVTNLGKLVLSLARQIEERSIIESGKMYVRTTHESIEEFNTHKIIQSLVREGSIPLELAQKVTEEVENRIYKYQTTYLTGSLIREMANSVLLEYGHEEYRNKLARLGLPVFDLDAMLANLDNADDGTGGLLSNTGQRVFTEHLMTNILPKDVADSHLSGDLHINNSGTWSMIPDTIFVNIKDLLAHGVVLGGKHINVSRIPPPKQLGELTSALSIIISLLSREASQEIVLDGLVPLLAKHAKSVPDLDQRILNALATASASSKYGTTGTMVSIRVPLGQNTKIVNALLDAYKSYATMTPMPRIGLVIEHDKDKIPGISQTLAEIVSIGGRILVAKDHVSGSGIVDTSIRGSGPLGIALQSVSINLPRLALESNKDETYFRARLVLLMKPALAAMALRKKDISDLTRRGLNPILAMNTQFMQRSSISLVVNLVGLREAVFDILGFQDNKEGRDVLHKVIETVVDVAAKKGKEFGDPIAISLTETDSSARFSRLDGEKYGKASTMNAMEGSSYSCGMLLDSEKLDDYTAKTEPIAECNRLFRILNGGMLVLLGLDKNATIPEIKAAIEKAASLVPSFRPTKDVPICNECGFKGGPSGDRCPSCKSPYMI